MRVKIGSNGAVVVKIQYTLHILGYNPNGFDGNFGGGTESAVRQYQSYYDLNQTGIVTDVLWTRMVRDIKPIRAQLSRKGFLHDGIGIPGGDVKVYAAVKSFQSSVGLTMDGMVGPATRVRLFSVNTSHQIINDDAFPLNIGAKGDNVLYLQYGLHILGCAPGALDGSFGNLVSTAVQRFQRKYGLVVDGSVGSATWSKMKEIIRSIQNALQGKGYQLSIINGIGSPETYNQVCNFQKDNGLTADGSVGPATWPVLMGTAASQASDKLPLVLGSSGENVKCVQYGLHICGFNPNGFDGSFGYGMQSAVCSFQSYYGLSVDGSVGLNTWNKILSEIKKIQQALATRGFYTADINGVPDQLTYQAVKNFQTSNNMEADGMAGSATKQALGITSASNSTSIGTTTSVLSLGCNGSLVRYLQKVLRKLGYSIDVDGSFGYGMDNVVKNFQMANGLEADGNFGPASWKKIFSIYSIPCSGSAPEKLAEVAEYELSMGFKEDNENDITPYGQWYGMNGQPWCAMFVSWCANFANILGINVPLYAYCPSGKNWFKAHGRYFSRTSGYKPKRGDVIFFWDGKTISHTGIVVKCEGNKVITIEGNSSYKVNSRTYDLSNTYIDGYGVVNVLPCIGDSDHHPDNPDNPDQIVPPDSDISLQMRALQILKALGANITDDTLESSFTYNIAPGIWINGRMVEESSLHTKVPELVAEGTQFNDWSGYEIEIEEGHIKVGANQVDLTDLYNEILNVEINGMTIEATLDGTFAAIGDGKVKFSFKEEGHSYCFELKCLLYEEIDAYQTDRLSIVIGIHIVKEQMHSYFSANQVEALRCFTNIAGNYEWKTDEVLIFLLVGLATIAFPEIIPYLCEKYMQYVLAI